MKTCMQLGVRKSQAYFYGSLRGFHRLLRSKSLNIPKKRCSQPVDTISATPHLSLCSERCFLYNYYYHFF